jgi:hypothetical protein
MAQQQDSPTGIPSRPLGKTGQRVSIIGVGGFHVGMPGCDGKLEPFKTTRSGSPYHFKQHGE